MPGPVYNSIVEIQGDGVTTQHEFSFSGGYISRDHVKARIIAADGGITPITVTPGMFVGDFTIDLGVAAPIGAVTRIYRETPRGASLVDFAGGSRITETNLDTATRQALFAAAEAFDYGEYANVEDLLAQAGVAASTATAAAAAALEAAAGGEANVEDYAALRAYAGAAGRAYVTGPGIAGTFVHIAVHVGADNGGTVVVGADGRRWVRVYNRDLHTLWFGTTAAAVTAALAAAAPGARVVVAPGSYQLASGSFTVPADVELTGGRNVILQRTSNTPTPLVVCALGASVVGIALDSTAGFTSASSVAVSAGSKVFTVPADLDVVAGQVYMAIAVGSAQNYMIGTVSSYVGTTLTLSTVTVVGSGTFTSWVLALNDGNNAAVEVAGGSGVVSACSITGRFYVGAVLRNSSGIVRDCTISGVVNRPVYLYGIVGGGITQALVENNTIIGNGLTQYGINLNGSGGSISNVLISGNTVTGTVFQGIEAGGSVDVTRIVGNSVRGTVTGSGILVQRANGVQPSRVIVANNNVSESGGTGILLLDVLLCSVLGNAVRGALAGITVQQVTAATSGQYNVVSGNTVTNGTVTGFLFTAAGAGLIGNCVCSSNIAIVCGIGFQSNANTAGITYTGNVSVANTTAYALLGTGNALAGNI